MFDEGTVLFDYSAATCAPFSATDALEQDQQVQAQGPPSPSRSDGAETRIPRQGYGMLISERLPGRNSGRIEGRPRVSEKSGKRIKSGAKLVDLDQETHLPVVRQRLYQAGVRLAWMLNVAFAE